MNILIFSLTILAMYGIIVYSFKLWKNADIKEKMQDIENTEENYKDIIKFKKAHKGNITKKEEVIKDFKQGV